MSQQTMPSHVQETDVTLDSDFPAKRRRIREIEVMVADVIKETHDTATLVLFTGNDHLEYKPGHFLTIDPHQFRALDRFTAYLEDIKGKPEPPRAYSLASAPYEKYLAITVKEERYVSGQTRYPPLLSPLLVRRAYKGTRMRITGFTGPYILPEDLEAKTDHLVHVCAGSGVVPNYSMIKHCLAENIKTRHTLIFSNKTWGDVIYRDQLAELQRQYPDKLKVVHTLTREPDIARFGPGVVKGRLNEQLLIEQIGDLSSCLVYCCGPGVTPFEKKSARERGEQPAPRFLEAVLANLAAIGIRPDQIRRESYG